MSAPAASAASSGSGRFRPQILTRTDMTSRGAARRDESRGRAAGRLRPRLRTKRFLLAAQNFDLALGVAQGLAVAPLAQPDGETAQQNAERGRADQDQKQRQDDLRRGNVAIVERIERDRDGLAIGQREDEQESRPAAQGPGISENCACLASHSGSEGCCLLRGRAASGQARDQEASWSFSRSRNSFPVLKKGTNFSATSTWSPVRGFRPTRASRS